MVEISPYVSPNNEVILSSANSYLNPACAKSLFKTLSLPSNWVYVYLVRHAESTAQSPNIIWWRSDEATLTEKWKKQAKFLWESLRKKWVIFDKVFSSTATRAFLTSRIVCESIWYDSYNIDLCHLIQEISNGKWEWLDKSIFRTPEIKEQMKLLTWDYKSPGWESQREVENRMKWWIAENTEKFIPKDWTNKIAFFSHALAIKCFLRAILNLKPSETWKLNIDNTSVTRLFYDGKKWYILAINDNTHLI